MHTWMNTARRQVIFEPYFYIIYCMCTCVLYNTLHMIMVDNKTTECDSGKMLPRMYIIVLN